MSERTQVQEPVIETLLYHHYLVIRINSGRRGNVWFYIWRVLGSIAQMAGITDLIGCSPSGRFFAVELKQPGGKPRQKQLEFMAEIEQRGGLRAVVDDARWEPPPGWN